MEVKYIIECNTCKHNVCGNSRGHACLTPKEREKTRKYSYGKEWKSSGSNFAYALWEPKSKFLFLDDKLFEI